MASSDLTLAMLGGGMGGMFSPYGMAMYNPQLIGPMQQAQFGQQLVQQGLSAAPAYPMQAISRLGQSLIGALMMRRGFQGLQNAGAASQQSLGALNDWINGGNAPSTQTPAEAQPAAAPQPSITLAAATHQLESGGSMKPGITGDGGKAGGPMQVHQAALDDVNAAMGTNYTMDQVINDPQIGKNVGDIYLALQQRKFPGHPELALAAYNAGPGATEKAVESGQGIAALPASTQQYVQRGMQLAQGGAPTEPQLPAIGMANPDVQKWVTQQQKARQALAMFPYQGEPHHELAQRLLDQSTEMLTIGAYKSTPSGTINTVTGQQTYSPSWRVTQDIHGNTIAVGPGGEQRMIAPNPTGISGNAPENVTMRGIAELSGKVANGTATPQEVATYNTLAESFTRNQIHEGPQGQLLRVPSQTLPVGAPQPQGMQQGPVPVTGEQAALAAPGIPPVPSAPGAAAVPPVPPAPTPGAAPQPPAPPAAPMAPDVQVLTGGSIGPQTAKAIMTAQGSADVENLSKEQAAVLPYHSILGTSATIRSMLPQVTTGVGADQRLAAARVLGMLGFDDQTQKDILGTSAPAGEILQKKLFELSTGAVRTMGAREPGSVLQMFQRNYPNMTSRNLTIDAMTRLLDMDQIYKEDELGARSHQIQQSVQGVSQGQPYTGLTNYHPPEVRLYQGAALASGGMPYSVWSAGLTPEQQADALRLAARVYPDASALDSQGVRHVFRRAQQ